MQLFFAPASPLYRKIWLWGKALGLADRIERITSRLGPVSEDAELCRHNPLGKIPTTVLDDGTALYDSRLITAYLNSLGTGILLPLSGDRFCRH
ncbi:glutathione S-transferase N-terminal domain-containing protein [Pacificimonas sp. ICDLI1SI03]